MKISELVERLKIFNEWRRGAEIDQPDPKQIGSDIDDAVCILKSLSDLIKKHEG